MLDIFSPIPSKPTTPPHFPRNNSFTLVELLIVIGILAILTASIVLIINPAQRLKEARDSTRIQELSALEHTISILLTQQDRLFIGTSTYVYTSLPDSSSTCGSLGLPTLPPGYTYQCVSEANLRNIDGTGWIPIDFSSTITQIPALPLDPINTTSSGLYYTYMMGGSFELAARFESTNYGLGGSHDMASTDGGAFVGLFEKGTNKGLIPLEYDPSLVGYWTFDEGSGASAYDYSGKGNDGTVYNSPTWQSAANCKVGGCLSFDGSDDYVRINNQLNFFTQGNKEITFSLWTVNSEQEDYQSFISDSSQSSTQGYIWLMRRLNDDQLQYEYSDGASHLHTDNSSYFAGIDGQWVYMAIVVNYQSGSVSFYRNGTLIENKTGLTMLVPTRLLKYYFGTYNGSNHMLNGSLDDIRIYNRALSPAEIQAIYNATK